VGEEGRARSGRGSRGRRAEATREKWLAEEAGKRGR
jgi:hypothetical protein